MRPEILDGILRYYIQEKSVCDEFEGDMHDGDDGAYHGDYSKPHHGGNLNMLPPPSVEPTSAERAKYATAGHCLSQMATVFSLSRSGTSPFKFKNPCIFVSPQDESVVVCIIRSSNSDDTGLKATWRTKDGTAVSGTHYFSCEGELAFDQSATEKEITIQLIPIASVNNELHFQVILEIETGDSNPVTAVQQSATINIKNINKFYDDEKQFVYNMQRAGAACVADIGNLLFDCLNQRTFSTALSYVCSQANSLSSEVAFAMELCRLCLSQSRRIRYDSMMAVVQDYFRNVDDELLFGQNH